MILPANPLAAYKKHQAELEAALRRVMESGRYILGPEVQAFEQEYAAWLGVKHAISVANGTEALWLALRAAGVGVGDEVLAPSMTASATVAAIVETGARPVFAELHPATLTLDPAQLSAALTPKAKAIVPVHLYGNPADMTRLMAFAHKHRLLVIEDCAQAHGAKHAGQKVGTFGALAAWSFYPTKNLGAFGDGGMVTTNDDSLAVKLKQLREYGWAERYHSSTHGWNSRLDEVQAALLRVRLKYLDEDNARRRAIAARYRAELPPTLPSHQAQAGDEGVEHLFVVRHAERERVHKQLKAFGVGAAIQYPVACHQQTAYAHFARPLPITEQAAREVFSLPMYPELTDNEVAQVIAACWQVIASL